VNQNDNRPAERPQDGRRCSADELYDGAHSVAYSVSHELGQLTDIIVGLAGRGIMLVPSVGTVYMHTTASASERDGSVVIRLKSQTGVRLVDFLEVHSTLGEYVDSLARAVLGGVGQCYLDGCIADEDESGSGYCSFEHYESDDVESVFSEEDGPYAIAAGGES
jgi:hypothetical protein